MMLPIERQERIKALIRSRRSMKISELSKELGVSEMTVHRDLKPLIEAGIVIKTYGGITLARDEPERKSAVDGCVICNRKVNERMAYRLILPENQIETACCAHCGLLRHRQLEHQVLQAICYDFFRQTTISAGLAWYVMDTTVHMGCCQPQILTFEWKEHAEKFVKGFGGKVYSFREALETVDRMMKNELKKCRHKRE
ncbi:copper uptake transcriptional regulator YcnK [Bacillaceae bacterium]